MTIVCGDSHTATHGALGALAFGIGTSEVEHVLATQCLWQARPKTLEIRVDGKLGAGVTAKDLILAIIGKIGTAGATGHVIEYRGPTIAGLTMEERMTVCNMSIEAGARAGMISPDRTTVEYLRGRPYVPKGAEFERMAERWLSLATDSGARFDRSVAIDAASVAPQVTWGTNPGMVAEVSSRVPDPQSYADPAEQRAVELALAYMGLKPGTPITDIKIDRVFIGSCTNGRLSDLQAAAAMVGGRKVAPSVHAMVVPGSQQVKLDAEAAGLDKIFKAAGFEWRESGCSMCLGMNPDILQPGERCASTSNRNFEGRQGKGGRTHLVSPAMAAAAAIEGHFVDVPQLALGKGNGMKAFKKFTGLVAPLDKPNVDTDQIIPKQFLKAIVRSGLGAGLFYDWRSKPDNPDFVLNQPRFKGASVLVARANFGCGSSREHAVWALDDFGFKAVIAPSFADIFRNNSLKNGFLPIVLTAEQVDHIFKAVAREEGYSLHVDLSAQTVSDESGWSARFEIEPFQKKYLLEGLDEIALTLMHEKEIAAYEANHPAPYPAR